MLQGLYDNNNDATKLELCPTIPISKEKIEEWCDPWKNAHIVDVLGRKLVLIMIEHKLHKERAKMWTLRIINWYVTRLLPSSVLGKGGLVACPIWRTMDDNGSLCVVQSWGP